MSKGNIFSPWPAKGRRMWYIKRESYAVRVGYRVDHDKDESTAKRVHWQWWAIRHKFKATYGRWPFWSFMFFDKFGFYIGWKPIKLIDPNFVVPQHFKRREKACEFSVRVTTSGGET